MRNLRTIKLLYFNQGVSVKSKIWALVISLFFVSATMAKSEMNPRVSAIKSNLIYEGTFVEGEVIGLIVKSNNDAFTLMLDSDNQIWFDDSFLMSNKEKKHVTPHLVKIFEEATDPQQKAAIATMLKAML
tara:strand:- start:7688 stop:8077 length:390 start_codon:yes stop_codon:yes gene_type:complete